MVNQAGITGKLALLCFVTGVLTPFLLQSSRVNDTALATVFGLVGWITQTGKPATILSAILLASALLLNLVKMPSKGGEITPKGLGSDYYIKHLNLR